MNDSFVYPRDAAEAIFQIPGIKSHLAEIAQHPDELFPSKEVLLQMLEVAFFASMEREEARHLSMCIAYVRDPAELSYAKHEDYHWMRLVPERDFSVSEIRRLASAFDPNVTMICISKSKSTSRSIISGILTRRWNLDLTSALLSTGFGPPRLFQVAARRPGDIEIKIGYGQTMQVRKGKIYIRDKNALYDGPIGKQLEAVEEELNAAALKKMVPPRANDSGSAITSYITFYRFFLRRIFNAIEGAKHGGSLVIVPEAFSFEDELLRSNIKLKYALNYSGIWETLVHWSMLLHMGLRPKLDNDAGIDVLPEQIRNNHRGEYQAKVNAKLIADAEFIAGLSSVDGAVVLTDRFRILGFGGEIITGADAMKPVYGVTPDCSKDEDKKIDVESTGTRHRSMYRFCAEVGESIGFVISQDGGVKAVKKVGDEVLVFQDV